MPSVLITCAYRLSPPRSLSLSAVLQDAFIPQDRESGRSRGFAFVTMADPAQAAEAIARLNDTEYNVRTNWLGRCLGGGVKCASTPPPLLLLLCAVALCDFCSMQVP